jgi:hypothetical protein
MEQPMSQQTVEALRTAEQNHNFEKAYPKIDTPKPNQDDDDDLDYFALAEKLRDKDPTLDAYFQQLYRCEANGEVHNCEVLTYMIMQRAYQIHKYYQQLRNQNNH